MQVGVGVRLRLVSGSMLKNLELFKEEVNTGAGWGWQLFSNTRWMLGSMSTYFEFLKEELNAGAGWGRGQIKVWVGVDNSFLPPD